MPTFEHTITTEPHRIRAVFVSDLHLSMHTPELVEAFVAFLADLQVLQALQHLFILGDFLDAWAGDDAFFDNPNHWLSPVVKSLNALTKTHIYLMHGNRDFMIGKALCQTLNATLIHEPYYLNAPLPDHRLSLFDDPSLNNPSHQRLCLMHGDRLCTDDKTYQIYRTFIQNPLTKQALRLLPLKMRQRLAGTLKNSSNKTKPKKPKTIMDVNQQAVQQVLIDCDTLIHGHTHRPHHYINDNKERIVLGDWRSNEGQVSAQVALLLADGEILLCHYHYPNT